MKVVSFSCTRKGKSDVFKIKCVVSLPTGERVELTRECHELKLKDSDIFKEIFLNTEKVVEEAKLIV